MITHAFVRLGIISMVLLVGSTRLFGSWAQLNGATDDEVLRNATNQGSVFFLAGINQIHDGMSMVDLGQLELAKGMGEEAQRYFNAAREQFQSVSNRLRGSPDLQRALDTYLRQVRYEEKAAALAFAEEPPPVWIAVRRAALSGAFELFGSIPVRISALAKHSAMFFGSVAERRPTAQETALLLHDIATSLEFGAYVSVVFATPPTPPPPERPD